MLYQTLSDNSIPFSVIVVTALVVLLLKIIDEIKTRREGLKIFDKGNVPSVPEPNLFSGHLFGVIFLKKNLHTMDKYHEKLGKTFGTFYGSHPWVFTCDAGLLHQLFVVEGHKFVNLNDFHMPYVTELDKSLAQLKDDDWRILRKALNPTFSSKQMKSDNVNNDIEEATSALIDCISKHPIQPLEDGRRARVVDAAYNCKKFSLEVIFKVAFGRSNVINMEPEARDPLIESFHEGAKMLTNPAVYLSVMFVSLQRVMGFLASFTKLGTYVKHIQGILSNIVEARRLMSRQEVRRDRKMIDTFLESVDRNNLDEEILKANLFFFLVAGFETTANTMAILLWLLAKNPEKQEKLRSELIRVGADDCQYLEWCIMEALRLYPGVPSGIGRELTEDFHYNGMSFFKGTSIVGSTYSMHRLPEYWGQDAQQYRPERFAEPFKHHGQYLAFGGGPRFCIGYNLAMIELRTLISRVIVKYRLEPCPTTPVELELTSPNLVHMIIHGNIDLYFIENT